MKELINKAMDFLQTDTKPNPKSYKPLLQELKKHTQNPFAVKDILKEIKNTTDVNLKIMKNCYSVYKRPKALPDGAKIPKVAKVVTRKRRRLHRGEYVTIDAQYEHRIVYKSEKGIIPYGWHIHHIDCDKSNNNIENLIALPPQLHNAIHDLFYKRKKEYNKKQIEILLNTYTIFMETFEGTELYTVIDSLPWGKPLTS